MYFLKMTKLMFIMRLSNITQYISHCFTSFTLGVAIKFLLISSVVQPGRPYCFYSGYGSAICMLQRLNILLRLSFSMPSFHPLFTSEYILRRNKQQQKYIAEAL